MIFILTKLNVSSFVLPIKVSIFAQKHYNMDKIEDVLGNITQEVTQADIEKINEEVEEQEASESTDENEEEQEPQPSRELLREFTEEQRKLFLGTILLMKDSGNFTNDEIAEWAWEKVNKNEVSVSLMPYMYNYLNGGCPNNTNEFDF